MQCRLTDLKYKEVINVRSGTRLGYIDDLTFNTETSAVTEMIIYGRPRFFGLFGKDEDIVIKCGEVEVIGEDTVLICTEESEMSKKKTFSLENLYK